MAEIHVERKRNPLWIILFIILALLAIWLIWEMLDDDEVVEPVAPAVVEQPVAPVVTPEPIAPPADDFVVPTVDATATPLEPQLRSPYVGRYVSDSITLVIGDDGNYEISRSPAGTGRGPWTVMRDGTILFLDPADGSQDRYFRIDDPDTLVPLNPEGEQPAQMTELLRRERTDAAATTEPMPAT